MAQRIKVPESAVRTRDVILSQAVVVRDRVWVICWNCNGTGAYPSSMIPAGQCRLYCWSERSAETFGRLPVPIERYVKREMAHDRRVYREQVRFEAERPEREAKAAEYVAKREAERRANEAEAIAREEARLALFAQRRYIGNVGERVTLPARAERVVRFENSGFRGGTRYLVRFRDEHDNALVVWTENLPFAIDREGDPIPEYRAVSLTGTVKAHDRYRDEPQTVLQRVKCSPTP